MKTEKAYFGGGCFWCTEAVFQRLKGVTKVVSGYSGGGKDDSPSYYKHGDHAESIEITYDPDVITYTKLLDVFWIAHNPTTLNRDGANVGRSYRSIILYGNESQQEQALESIKNSAPKYWKDPIVTEVVPLDKFTPAEDYHQNFYNDNPETPYCTIIIDPKLKKLQEKFSELLK